MTNFMPAGPISEMRPEDQDRIGQRIAEEILEQVTDRHPIPISEVLNAVSIKLAIPRDEMLYGLMFGEAASLITIDHFKFTISPHSTRPSA